MKSWQWILCVAAILFTSCGHPDSFRVQGHLDDGATINLRVIYHTSRGVKTGITSSNDGVFAFEGSSPETAMVEVYDNDYRLQARFPARNGEDIKIEIARANRFASHATGTPDAEEFTGFLQINADSLKAATPAQRNRIFTSYITENPASISSLMLLWGEFDPARDPKLADSLTNTLDPALRSYPPAQRFLESLNQLPNPKADSIVYRAHGGIHKQFIADKDAPALLVFSAGQSQEHKVLNDSLHRLVRLAKTTPVKVFDFSCDADTATWNRITYTDSATWTQGWLEAGPAAPQVARLRLPILPYYLVVDSTGSVISRSTSIDSALNIILKSF